MKTSLVFNVLGKSAEPNSNYPQKYPELKTVFQQQAFKAIVKLRRRVILLLCSLITGKFFFI